LLALALALALALVLAGCQAPERDELRFGLADGGMRLDPRYGADAASTRVQRLLYRRLVAFDARSRPVPDLASWERVNPVHYRFRLGREGRVFHDGGRLTSRDVKATYESVLAPGTASPHRGPLTVIRRISAPDADTVDFYLRRPDPFFPGYLQVGIVPARLLASGHRLQDAPVGSGPLEFAGRPDDHRLRLRRRGDGQTVAFLTVKDPTVRVLKLLRGEVDLIQNDLPPELLAYLSAREKVRVVQAPGINFTYLGFNLTDPVTGDLRIRRAIAHAIDRAAVIEHLWRGAAQPAQSILRPDHWAGHPGLDPIPHDLVRARALLAELGHGPANPLAITYKTSTDPLRVRVATIFQHQLAKAGIRLDIRSYDWGTFFGDIKSGRFQMYALAWVGIRTPDIFRYAFHSDSVPPGGANRGRYRSPRADALIEAAEAAPTRRDQAPWFRELQALLLEDLPYVPLWYEDQVLATRADIQGYPLAADGSYDGLVTASRGARGGGPGAQPGASAGSAP
jgi:peptide/nickel transport system substrate-binding protein